MADSNSKFVADLAQIGRAVTQGGTELQTLNVARERQSSLATDNQILTDRQALTPFEFGQKYGSDVQKMLNQADLADAALSNYMLGATRTASEQLTDTGINLGTGLVNSIGGIPALAAGIVSDEAGTRASELLGSTTDVIRSPLSEYQRRNEYVEGLRSTVDEIDNLKQYEEDKKTDDAFLAGLKYFGRGAMDSAERIVSNPAALESTIAQGTGSLLAGGPLAKGLQLAGVTARAAMPLAVGLMEGGGTYTSTAQEIMSRSHEELMASSPDYKALVEGGQAPDEAKRAIANTAALTAAAIQAPIAAVTSKVTGAADFEAAPLASKTFTAALKDIGKETIEEGLQSTTGQLAQNLGISVQADPEQNLLEGAGDQLALGALGGMGAGVVVQAPSAAKRAVVEPFKYAKKKGIERLEAIKADVAKASPVAPEKVAPQVEEQVAQAPQVAEALRSVAKEAGANPEDTEAYINRFERSLALNQDDVDSMPDSIGMLIQDTARNIGRVPNKFEAMAIAADLAVNDQVPENDRLAAATFVLKSAELNKKLYQEDYPEFMQAIPQDRPEAESFRNYGAVLAAIEQTPKIREVLQWAREQMQQSDTMPDIPTPDFVNNTVDIATHAPQAMSSTVASEILKQADEGTLQLSPERRRILRSAVALQDASRVHAAQIRTMEPMVLEAQSDELVEELDNTRDRDERMEFVGRQIATEGGAKATQLSLRDHVAGINLSASQGDMKGARQKLIHLARFAKSHINKLAAINQSIANGDGRNVPYRALSSNGEFYEFKKGVGVRVGNPGNERFARTVHAEALAIAQLANEIAAQYPEFNIPQQTVPELNLAPVEVESQDKEKGSPAVANVPESGATTAQTDTDSQQAELPAPSPAPRRAVEAQVSVGDETEATDTTVEVIEEQAGEPAQENAEPITPEPTTEESISGSAPSEVQTGGPADDEIVAFVDSLEPSRPVALQTRGVFPFLVEPSGVNKFHDAFRMPDRPKSRLMNMVNPLQDLDQVLSSTDALRWFMQNNSVKMSREELARMTDYLALGGQIKQVMKDRAKKVLDEKKDGKSLLRRIHEGEPVLQQRRYLALNLLERRPDEGYAFNAQLTESAIVAALDWALNAQSRTVPVDREDAASILGIREEQVTEDHLLELNRGTSVDMAVRTLGASIRRFWGVDTNREAPDNYVHGIPEAVAKEMLYGLADVGLIDLAMQVPFDGSVKKLNRVWFDNRDEDMQNFLKSMNGYSNLLADMAMIEREVEDVSAAGPIEDIDTRQLRNSMVELTEQHKQALKNAQATPYRPNLAVFDFFQAMGREAFVTLMSGREFKDGDLQKKHTEVGLNKNHWNSVQGLQRSLSASYANVEKQMAMLKKHASDNGIPVEEAALYYKHHINRLGRPQMGGLANPQSDKHAREIFMPTKDMLNLTDPAQLDRFMMTIGQGIGLKTEKLPRATIVEEVRTQAMTEGGKLYPLVQSMQTWLRDRASGNNALPAGMMAELKAAKLSQHGIQSLLSLARYNNAVADGADLSQFETFSYLEADGKTNGPINALMTMARGPISETWLKTVAKGGAFFGRLGKSLNAHMSEDDRDLYKEGSIETNSEVAKRAAAVMADVAEGADMFEAFKRMLSALNVDINITEDGDISVERGLTKNPLTITIYGSGEGGIAGKVVDELVGVIYEKLSQSIQDGVKVGELIYGEGKAADFISDLNLLSSQVIRKGRKGKFYLDQVENDSKARPSAADYTLEGKARKAFEDNVLAFLVQPMRAAIETKVTKHTKDVTETIQKTTQIQSVFLQALFLEKIAERLAMKAADPEKYGYRKGDALSAAEMDAIRDQLKTLAPFITTGTQSYYLSGGETTNLESPDGNVTIPRSFSKSLTDDLETPAYYEGATLAGVKATPTLVVGSGDGQMQIGFLADNVGGSALRAGHVFDGSNFPASKIDDYSRLINEQVFKTWTSTGNPVRAAYESFAKFMEKHPFEQIGEMSQKMTRKNLTRTMTGLVPKSEADYIDMTEAKEQAEIYLERLRQLANETDARRKTYAEFTLSVDQMASAESPFVNDGSIQLPENVSYDALAEAMSERYQENLAEVRKQQAIGPMSRMVEGLAPEDSTVARVIRSSQLAEAVSRIEKDLSPTQLDMAKQAAKILAGSDYRVAIGTAAQLDRWEQTVNPERYSPVAVDFYGKVDPVAKIITILDGAAPETMVHELVHAATIDKVAAYYADPSSLSTTEREAVARIEGLMEEWLELDTIGENSEGYFARHRAEAEIENRIAKGQMAAAVNEFMAWVLGNQDLARFAAKTKVKNPLFKIVGDVLLALKTLIWGDSSKGPKVGDDILSQLRFNTHLLMAMPSQLDLIKQFNSDLVMYQSASFGSNERLTSIREALDTKLMAWVKGDINDPVSQTTKIHRENAKDANVRAAADLANTFARFFPGLGNMQAWSTFSMVQAAMMTDIELNPNALGRIQEIYTHVMDNLTVASFRKTSDPEDLNDITRAENKLNALAGVFGVKTDSMGRSSLMSSFLALATVDDEFRSILADMEKPKAAKTGDRSVDGVLEDYTTAAIDRVSIALAGENGKDASVKDALDSLTRAMIDNVGDQRIYIERTIENGIERFEDMGAQWLQDKSAMVAEKSADIARNSSSRIVKAGAVVVNLVATAINEQKSQDAAQGLIEWLNRRGGLDEIRALVNDVVGRTKDNAHVVDMVNLVRTTVQQVRQRFREDLPKMLAGKFQKAPSQEQWTAMFKALGKTDIAGLVRDFGVTGALDLVSDNDKLEAAISGAEQGLTPRAIQKSKQLAHFMNTGEHGNTLYRNAHAIAFKTMGATPDVVRQIDKMVSLYAIQGLSQSVKDRMAELLTDEREGVEYVTSYLVGQRRDELEKIGNNKIALLNHYKGHIPSETQQGGSLVIQEDSKHDELILQGYSHVADYKGSAGDVYAKKRSYYFSPVSPTAQFNQGVLQTVHTTVSGIDPETGFTMGEVLAGRITGDRGVSMAYAMMNSAPATAENLLPVLDEDGQIVAYERAADPAHLVQLNKSTDLARMIGVWHGRQMEELLAKQVNEAQIDRLHDEWIKGQKDGRRKEFVNIAKLKSGVDDPILLEAARLLPRQTRSYAASKFGPNEFWVRRDVLLDVFGSRQASVGDFFTGATRWDPRVASRFEKLALTVFKTKAYPWLVSAEKNVQEVIANFKTTIVVRSVVVPAANLVSNMFQLLNRGVPLRSVLKGVPAKTAEINAYIRSQARKIEAEADLRAAQGRNDIVAIRRLSNELRSIDDAHRRMSIWPLIAAGEFSAISSGAIQVEDLALADGKWSSWLERKINSLPAGLRQPLRYGLVTRDTALFRGLARATQYGDFVAKAILYDDMVKRQKISAEDAIPDIADAFVNYNRPMGRGRQYLESVGLLWFYNYKLRIMKEAAYTLRHHPLRSLLMAGAPSLPLVGSVGSPAADNILAVALEGDLGWSIGPSMGLNSFNLNPWVNLAR